MTRMHCEATNHCMLPLLGMRVKITLDSWRNTFFATVVSVEDFATTRDGDNLMWKYWTWEFNVRHQVSISCIKRRRAKSMQSEIDLSTCMTAMSRYGRAVQYCWGETVRTFWFKTFDDVERVNASSGGVPSSARMMAEALSDPLRQKIECLSPCTLWQHKQQLWIKQDTGVSENVFAPWQLCGLHAARACSWRPLKFVTCCNNK